MAGTWLLLAVFICTGMQLSCRGWLLLGKTHSPVTAPSPLHHTSCHPPSHWQSLLPAHSPHPKALAPSRRSCLSE
jgi:hypothetical protein